MINFTSRADLGWPATKATAAHPTKGVVIHFDGSDQHLGARGHTACVEYWNNTRSFHTGPKRGWKDIGYSYGVCPHGEVFEGRGLDREQAAQPGGNTTWYSITFMGGPGPHEDPTPSQLQAFQRLRTYLMEAHGVGSAIKGHRDFISTDCPGDRLYRMVTGGALAKPTTKPIEPKPPAKPAKPVKPEGADMSTEVWEYEIPVPWADKDNPDRKAKNLLVEICALNRMILDVARQTKIALDAQGALIKRIQDELAGSTS